MICYDDCFIKVYRSFPENFHECINIAINVFYIFSIMLNAFFDPLCSKLSWHNLQVPNDMASTLNEQFTPNMKLLTTCGVVCIVMRAAG